jgi:putative SOS response-associated peptidase YedK
MRAGKHPLLRVEAQRRPTSSAFFKFTGKKYSKAKHRLTLKGAPFLAIAGLWRDHKAEAPPAFG